MDKIETDTAMLDETIYSGLQNLSLLAENSHFNHGDLYDQGPFPVESSYESIASCDQAITSTQYASSAELPIHQSTSFDVNQQLLEETGSQSSYVHSAESLTHEETLENRTDCIRNPRAHCSMKSDHRITIHTNNGPVTFKYYSQKLTDSSEITSATESTLLELYEERERLLRNNELLQKLMMFQKALQLRKK